MKLLRTYAAMEIYDLEQDVIEVTSDDCNHGNTFRQFCFVSVARIGGTVDVDVMPGNVWEMAKNMNLSEEETATFVAKTEKDGHELCWFNKTGSALTNGYQPGREKWFVLNQGQKVMMQGHLFIFGVDTHNNPFLNIVKR